MKLEGALKNMKKIIPFKKEIIFKTNLAEITSISLEHSLHKEDDHLIAGSFSLNGEYKITDASTSTEVFSYDLPFDIHMEDHYVLDHATVDIDDFYYEIVNENVLSINIDVCIDKLEEKPLMEKEERKEPEVEEIIEPVEVKSEMVTDYDDFDLLEREDVTVVEEVIEKEEKKEVEVSATLFGSMDESTETYMTYRVYIIREGDSIDGILNKYGVSREELAAYNDLSEVKLGDKLIIPAIYHATSE